MAFGDFSCRTQRAVPGGQDSSILPAWVANHSTGFGSSCPLNVIFQISTKKYHAYLSKVLEDILSKFFMCVKF